MRALYTIATLFCAATVCFSQQDFAPPNAKVPEPAELKALTERAEALGRTVGMLSRNGIRDPYLADVEVYQQGVMKLIEHKEFFHVDSLKWAHEAIDRGMLRARFLAVGQVPPPWAFVSGYPVIRGYRSRVDGSVQPYAVTYPTAYGKEPTKKWRTDVVLHGRDKTITEVKFLHAHNGDKAAAADLNHVKIDIFGRGNNAYRWAGEVDVFEATDNFFAFERAMARERLIDDKRVILRGFSMGGAGTWHLGLHWPDRWCVIGPGAGFTTTRGYTRLPDQLPAYQEACLHIYDAVDYAENAFDVPIVAYSGGKDPQMQAAVNIEERLKKLGISMTHLIAPDLPHTFPPEWQKKADVFWSKFGDKGKPTYPPQVKFVTYTLKYPMCYWVELLQLERHYLKTVVNAERLEDGFKIETANVRAFHLDLPEGVQQPQNVSIDGQKLVIRPVINPSGTYHIYLQKRAGSWQPVLPQRLNTERAQHPQKITGLTGPIDDAFAAPFLCVRGTDKPLHLETQKYADDNLRRFQAEFSKFFRGSVPLKDDIDVNAEDIASKSLILFGDPASNSLITQVLDGLPLTWTKDAVTLDGQKYSAAEHVPVLIYPNPLNADRYVVLNSGHTFHAPEFLGTNALLYPRLGDYAILKLAPTERDPLGVEVVTAGLFDEFWRVAKK